MDVNWQFSIVPFRNTISYKILRILKIWDLIARVNHNTVNLTHSIYLQLRSQVGTNPYSVYASYFYMLSKIFRIRFHLESLPPHILLLFIVLRRLFVLLPRICKYGSLHCTTKLRYWYDVRCTLLSPKFTENPRSVCKPH